MHYVQASKPHLERRLEAIASLHSDWLDMYVVSIPKTGSTGLTSSQCVASGHLTKAELVQNLDVQLYEISSAARDLLPLQACPCDNKEPFHRILPRESTPKENWAQLRWAERTLANRATAWDDPEKRTIFLPFGRVPVTDGLHACPSLPQCYRRQASRAQHELPRQSAPQANVARRAARVV